MDILIKQIRGGSLTSSILGNFIFLVVIYGILLISNGTEGFIQPENQAGFRLSNGFYDPPGFVRPIDCDCSTSTQLFAGSPTQSLKT